MDYILKPHAKQRMKERDISEELVRGALQNPTQMRYDAENRLLIKKIYSKSGKKRLLLIAGEIKDGEMLEIITVIDTSKVKKYL